MYAEPTPSTAIPSQPDGSTGPSASASVSGWDPQRDEPFFRLIASLFPPSFTAGAGVLLASYDEA